MCRRVLLVCGVYCSLLLVVVSCWFCVVGCLSLFACVVMCLFWSSFLDIRCLLFVVVCCMLRVNVRCCVWLLR